MPRTRSGRAGGSGLAKAGVPREPPAGAPEPAGPSGAGSGRWHRRARPGERGGKAAPCPGRPGRAPRGQVVPKAVSLCPGRRLRWRRAERSPVGRAVTRGPGGHPCAERAEAAAEESSARRMRLSDLAEGFTKCLPISKFNYVFSVLFVLKYFSDMELHTHICGISQAT